MIITRDDAASRQRGVVRSAFLGGALFVAASLPAGAAEGVASFYGRSEHGGPTASGERFNMHAMTAAHRTAPLGSHMRVTNLKNGRSVVVRINDRGPFVRGRIIDLSQAAANELGFVGAGLTRVALETVTAGEGNASTRVASESNAATRVAAAEEPETTGSTPEGRKARHAAAKPADKAQEKAAEKPAAPSDEVKVALEERDAYIMNRNRAAN